MGKLNLFSLISPYPLFSIFINYFLSTFSFPGMYATMGMWKQWQSLNPVNNIVPSRPGLTETINLEENMKTKLFNKKLNFSKETVAHLDANDLERARGGLSGYTCPDCFPSQIVTCNCPTQCTSDRVCSC